MKPLAELDHYEILEVAREARPDEIERAFALVRSAYEGDSLAAYSMVPPDEAKLWRERIDEAFRVLSNAQARRAYDAALDAAAAGADEDADPFADADDGLAPGFAAAAPSPAPALAPGERAPLPEAPSAPPRSLVAAHAAQPLRVEEGPRERLLPRELEAFEAPGEGEADDWDGPRLRRARMLRGLDIEDVAAATKVNPTYLRFLEEERFEDLPAAVYVRGFVAAYARLLGLDATRVAPSYVARCEEQRAARPRSRLLGRPHGR
jgi:flagellar biosynthesis protein FlhG